MHYFTMDFASILTFRYVIDSWWIKSKSVSNILRWILITIYLFIKKYLYLSIRGNIQWQDVLCCMQKHSISSVWIWTTQSEEIFNTIHVYTQRTMNHFSSLLEQKVTLQYRLPVKRQGRNTILSKTIKQESILTMQEVLIDKSYSVFCTFFPLVLNNYSIWFLNVLGISI